MADYIEREYAADAVADVYYNTPDINLSCEKFEAAILKIPAADVAPVVHGRWEQCFEDWRQQIEGDKCSVCGFEHYGASTKKYKYCPNCGTLMDLEG